MTQKEEKVKQVVNSFDRHFAFNKKRPADSKIEDWFDLNAGVLDRSTKRKAFAEVMERAKTRWGVA